MIRSLKQILNSEESEPLKNLLKRKKKELEKDFSKKEQINDDFLLTMLSNGYINEEYRFYIESNDKVDLNIWERFYLNNVKDELDPDFTLQIEHDELVANEIKDYQWSSPSILNNNILTYLILHDLPNQVNWFINAILNYYEKYQKNDFVDQYVDSINNLNNKKEIINYFLEKIYKKLQLDISNDIKIKILLSIFSTNSESLFCDFLINNFNSNDNFSKLLNNFFENRKSILDYILVNAKEDVILDLTLYNINLEIEKLPIYNDSTQKLLLNNAMFQISKENLDYLMKQNVFPPYSYYDYIRNKSKLKKKISNSKDIEKFVNEILLAKDKLYISKEGIVDLLFTTLIQDDIAEKVTAKLDNEFIDLTYVPKFCKDNTTSILALNTNLFHILINQNKIKIDFNNVLYLSSSCTAEDTILFAQKQINRQAQNTSLVKIDTFAKDHFLPPFYNFLLTEQKVDLDLYEKESIFLIQQNIDILELITPLIKEQEEISPIKMQMLVTLAFRRSKSAINNNYNRTFFKIIEKEFIYFCENFANIKNKSDDNWKINISILLKNDYNTIGDNQLDSIINLISLDEFGDILKLWSNDIGIFNSSKTFEKILNKKRLTAWLKKFGSKKILNFLSNIKDNIDDDTIYKLNTIIEESDNTEVNPKINDIIEIAKKYNLYPESIINYSPHSSYFRDAIKEILKKHKINWVLINLSVFKVFRNKLSNNIKLINDLFIVGRYFYLAIERGSINVHEFLSTKYNYFLNHSQNYFLNPVLCGAIFEAYFDHEGKLKKNEKKLHFDQIMEQFERNSHHYDFNFIRDCLNLFKERFMYIPGDSDVIFDIIGEKYNDEIKIYSLKCRNIELLTNRPLLSGTRILPTEGFQSDLIRVFRQLFTIPEYRIKFNPPLTNDLQYTITDNQDLAEPLESIILQINQQKNTDFDFI